MVFLPLVYTQFNEDFSICLSLCMQEYRTKRKKKHVQPLKETGCHDMNQQLDIPKDRASWAHSEPNVWLLHFNAFGTLGYVLCAVVMRNHMDFKLLILILFGMCTSCILHI